MAKPGAPQVASATEPEQDQLEEEVIEGAPMWYLSFADMMTNMFIFFALIAAISTVETSSMRCDNAEV